MTEKLEITEKRFDEINEKLTDINVINDQEQYKSLMKELKNLTPIIEKYRMYKTARSDFEEAEQMLSDGGLDKDFKEIVQEQYESNKKLMDEYTDELKILLLPKDPDDDRNVIIVNIFFAYIVASLGMTDMRIVADRMEYSLGFILWVILPLLLHVYFRNANRVIILSLILFFCFFKLVSVSSNAMWKYENVLLGAVDYEHRLITHRAVAVEIFNNN